MLGEKALFGLPKLRRPPADKKGGISGILGGAFDLQGDTLVGHVERLPHFSNSGMKVLALRGVQVVAECEAVDLRGRGNMPFTMAIDGRFTVAELAREAVLITARNARGDSGLLTMNGATRIELIRQHMGVPVKSLLELDFSEIGNAALHLGAGWWRAEQKFTWTADDDSYVQFPANCLEGTCCVRFRCSAFISTFVPRQLMELFINDHPIGSYTEDQAPPHFREFRFKASEIPEAAKTNLRIHHPYAARPSDECGSGDKRRIAYRFYRMSLVREI